MKICTKCHVDKPESDYYSRANGRLESRCKDCHKALSYAAAKSRREETIAVSERLVSEGATKYCAKCERALPVTEFNRQLKSADGFASSCRSCASVYAKRYYEENKAAYKSMSYASREHRVSAKRDYYANYLREHPCVDCGNDNILVLQADHENDKMCNISTMVSNGVSLQSLMTELEKCVIRCANCHQIKTAHDFGFWRLNYV